MLYLLIILAVYSARYCPELYSRPLLVLPSLGLLLVLSDKEERSLMLLRVILLFSLLSSSLPLSSPASGLSEEKCVGVYGTVTSDTAQRTGRKTGFSLNLSAVEGKGSVHSAQGEIFVLAPQSDFLRGDEVYLEGSFNDGFYKAKEVLLLHRPQLTSLRRKLLEGLRGRLRAGELGLRLLTGNGDDGGYELTALARSAGLSHVLALSGMHLAVLSSLLEALLKRFTDKSWWISTAFLSFFTWLCGSKASLLRALCFRVSGRFLEREEALLLSFILTILLSPSYASSLALHYSLLSLSGILWLSEPLGKELSRLTHVPFSITGGLSASASALLFTVPVTLDVFGSYTLGAVLASVPATALITLYLALASLSLLFPVLGLLLLPLERVITAFFTLCSEIPSSSAWGPYIALAAALSALLVSKAAGRMLDFR